MECEYTIDTDLSIRDLCKRSPLKAMVTVMRKEMENHLWFYVAMALMIAISFLGGVVTYRLVLWMGF